MATMSAARDGYVSGESPLVSTACDGATLADVVFSQFVPGEDEETQMNTLMQIIDAELSEPYTVFTYRYFIKNWPELCVLAWLNKECIGVVICKLDQHRESFRGYVGMLVVTKPHRDLKLGSSLVSRALGVMRQHGADECVLEVESTNKGALRLYENLGFIRDKRLERYYLSGGDAYRMKLLFPLPPSTADDENDIEYEGVVCGDGVVSRGEGR
jgi:peptide alpha-N-acetyltransferase